MIVLLCELQPGRHTPSDLRRLFRAAFGVEPEPGDAGGQHDRIGSICRARAAVRGDSCDLFSAHAQAFWDAQSRRYLSPQETVRLLNGSALLDGISAGTLRPAIDAPLLIVDKRDSTLSLFSSCSGASVFYYTVRDGLLYAADHMGLLKIASDDPVDPVAVAEVIRFGANYCQRSLIGSIRRIPFGHVVRVTTGRVADARSYIDYSWQAPSLADRSALKSELKAALAENVALSGPTGAELLFSSGVDSSILGAIGKSAGRVERGWFMSMGDGDPQRPLAEMGAARGGFQLEVVSFKEEWSELERTVAAYSEPTLDFSILPTRQLISAIHERAEPQYLLDGTGGDAWFGFGSLAHARVWGKLSVPAQLMGRAASYVFSRNLKHATSRWTFPLMVLARVPASRNSALGHMCANSVWRQMTTTTKRDWRLVEEEISETLARTGPSSANDELGQVILSDATMIAVSQFAAKTGPYSARGTTQTLYPFLMPNVVEIGRRVPANLMVEDGVVKPLLKEIACELGFDHEYIYRTKSGFQPPLERLMRAPANLEKVAYWIADHEDELSDVFTPFARDLPAILGTGRRDGLNLKSLYCLWGVLAVRIWLHHFRARR